LVAATRTFLGRGVAPTIEQAAREASVSRATAYRYFRDQDGLIAAAYPMLEADSLLGEDPPDDPEERLEIVLGDIGRQLLEHEPALRATFRVSLAPPEERGSMPLRTGRAIGWIEDALEPLRADRSPEEIRRLAIAIRACYGIEPFIWLVDVAGVTRAEALEVMRETALMRLRAALV
jgi:AcrR family transcriptional regulator